MSRLVREDEERCGRLLVAVRGLSGTTYPAGTTVRLVGRGCAVDGWVGGEWVPLRWWEFAEASTPAEPVSVAARVRVPAAEGRGRRSG
jgi:hypothetical protein